MPSNISFQFQDIICIAPAIFIFLGSLLPLTLKVLNQNREPSSILSVGLASLGILAGLASAGLLYAKQEAPYYAFSNALVFDGVSVLATMLILVITLVSALLAREHIATPGNQFSETLFLLLNAAFGMMILAWSNDLIMTFIAIEIMSLCLYLLIAICREEQLSKEAAFKYFILGSLASAIFLYGIAFIYGVSGTTYLHKIIKTAPELMASSPLFFVGATMAILGFCFKAGIAPFHVWAPDVYTGSPTPVTTFMAAGVKLVTFVAFLRFIQSVYNPTELSGNLLNVLQWLAVLTMVVGNVAAIVQNNLKRMLAYSSIAHSGYIMMGLIAAATGGESWRGELGVIYYVIAYTIMTLGAFSFVCLMEKNENDQVTIDDLKGLASRSPILSAFFALFMLSLAGIPPLIGFFGKFFLFSAVIKQGLFWLAIWAAINSAISAYYYLRPIVWMYMMEEGTQTPSIRRHTVAITAFMGILVVILGIFTEPVYKQVILAIRSLV